MVIFNMLFIIIYLFFLGNMIFVSKYKHLLVVLLSLEFIILSIYFFILMIMMFFDYNMYMLMVFLIFSVCEGALGLSIMVSLIRTHGKDYFLMFNML